MVLDNPPEKKRKPGTQDEATSGTWQEDGSSIFNPIDEYTDTKYAEGKTKASEKAKYRLSYPYEWNSPNRYDDGEPTVQSTEYGTALFPDLKSAMEAKTAGLENEYFTSYEISKIKSLKPGRPKLKRPNGITGGQAKAFFKRVNKSTSRTTRSIAKKPKSISKSIAKKPKSISKSIAKRPKSMIKKATRIMRRK